MRPRLRDLIRRAISGPPAEVQAPSRPRPAPPPPGDAADEILAYHRRTRHAPGRFASALPYMDWDTQPDPFRRFDGAPVIPLSLRAIEEGPPYEPVFVRDVPVRPLDLASLSQLFLDSLGLSAWKQAGDARWSLRVNPSSGNLHPTEAYLICGPTPGLAEDAAVYHYQPHDHVLERRADVEDWAALHAGLPEGAVLVALTSVVVRESWKYGERAFRYCQHDAGHAIAAISLAAAAMGWSCLLLESVPDAAIATLCGSDRQSGPEAEHAECLLLIWNTKQSLSIVNQSSVVIPEASLSALRATAWAGEARALASEHQDWPVIGMAIEASLKKSAPAASFWATPTTNRALQIGTAPFGFRTIAHQRRSAVDMDGRTGISAAAFYQMMVKALPGAAPFDSLPWRPRVDLLLFVHRVAGLVPGLYALVRDPGRLAGLKTVLDPEFLWTTPKGCPEHLPLFHLQDGDARALASGSSCGQAIAADGCFAVAMLAEHEAAIRAEGAWLYRRTHWEAGAIGQILYLEAEASGVRATGIGCFFDGSSARAFGLSNDDFAVIYHFTVGGPVEDTRLDTLPAYGHLSR